MIGYVLKRVGYMFFTLFMVISITFFLMHSMPGDPLARLAVSLPEETRQNYYEKYGLDKPKFEQYTIFLGNLLKGDLGESLVYPGRNVTQVIKDSSSVSAQIGIHALIWGFSIGVTLGVIAALFKNRLPDYFVMFIAILGVTLPVFVLASLLQYFFTVQMKIFPTTGWGSLRHMILPIVTLAVGSVAAYARYMKSSVLEVINQDYILTAQAKGVSSFRVITDHVLRNAILPAITILGPRIVGIFTGAFVTERIFGIPGIGYYYVGSINDRDYTMILGTTIFYATLFIVIQLLVDIIYSTVDPRIRVSGKKK